MGWEDGLALLSQPSTSKTDWTGWQRQQQQKWGRAVTNNVSAYSPYRASTARRSVGAGSGSTAPSAYSKASFPEKIEVKMPWSSQSAMQPPPPKDTTGDLAGSLGASVGNAFGEGGYLNLANVIPWGMERMGVLADNFSTTLTGDDQNAISQGLDLFSGGLKAVAEPIAQALDLFPNTMRDQSLRQRAEMYRDIVVGKVDPISAGVGVGFNSFFSMITGGLSNLVTGQGEATRIAAMDPDMAKRQAALMSIDLPESVKLAIRANPAGDINKYLDAAPEGKQFSYVPGLHGAATNLLLPGALYGLEAVLGGGLIGGAVKAGSAYGALDAGAARFGAKVATDVVRGAFAVQKAALATGVGYFGLSIAADTAARTMGNKEAVEWWDKLNRGTLISDDPAIQLVTSFSVDPLGALNLARKGTIKAAHGLSDITVGKVLGTRMSRLYTSDDLILDRLGQMYGVSREEAAALIGPSGAYETKGEAVDRIVEIAWDHINQTLPDGEAIAIGAIADAHQRATTVLQRYGSRIVDLIEKHPEALAGRFRRAWEYHEFDGPFDPAVMQVLERDYLLARNQMAQARASVDGVVGYVDFLNPEGQARMASDIDALFARGNVTLRDLNQLKVKYPALNKITRDIVSGSGARAAGDVIERSVFDTALERATAAYDDLVKRNPKRAATGSDPILRPNSVRRVDEYAEALGTTPAVVRAVESNPGSLKPEDVDLLRGFAREKGLNADGTAEEVWGVVNDYVDDSTKPWRERGAQVENLEAEQFEIQRQLQEIELGRDRSADAKLRQNELAARSAQIGNLLADVRDPNLPFTQGVRYARKISVDAAELERAQRRVQAETALDNISAIDDEVDAWNTIGTVSRRRNVTKITKEADGTTTKSVEVHESKLSPLYMIRERGGAWRWAGTATPFSESLYSKLADFLYSYKGAKGQRQAANMAEMGDEDLWKLAVENKDSAAFRKVLTAQQRKTLDAKAGMKSTLDEYKDAWARRNGMDRASASDEDFLAYLAERREARDAALSGRSEYAVRRSADAKVSEWALERARAGQSADLYFDPEADLARGQARAALAKAVASEDSFPAVRDIVRSDDVLYGQAQEMAEKAGRDVDDFLRDPANREQIATLAGDAAEPVVPGVPRAQTDLDQAILGGDKAALDELRGQLDSLRGQLAPPLTRVPKRVADALARQPRRSSVLARDMADAGVSWHEVIDPAEWAKRSTGGKVASMILHGTTEHPPKTLGGLLTVLKEIESGNAANIGIGTELAAEAQRAAREIIEAAVGGARKSMFDAGVIGMGKGLNPYTWGDDTLDLMRDLFGRKEGKAQIVVRDDLLGLQYGLKKRPKDQVVLEMATVPGAAEELLTGHFRPWSERAGAAQVRQLYNYLFGPLHNQEIAFKAYRDFTDRLAPKGIPANLSSRIWRKWKETAKESRGTAQEKSPTGEYQFREGDNALYASEKNIPNAELNAIAHREMQDYFGGDLPDGARTINFADEFRISGSGARASLEKVPVLGDMLQQMYGNVVHNKFTTTMYYMFRFGLDLRFHALNFFEGPMLYLGRSGAKVSELDEGMFGYTRKQLASQAADGLNDTGYPFSHSRMAWAYRTFLKEQPQKLRGLLAEDPALMTKAIDDIIKHDPELGATIRAMGDTPESYMKAMDAYYRKVMNNVDPGAAAADEAIKAMADSPELAEVLGRIAEVNKSLWDDVRATFYGNPARPRVERWMNHYLLYWPISYQIKATKWMLRIMFDRAGGVKTNAGGAYLMDQLQQRHVELMQSDPEYARTFEENPSLIFAAQMMFPMTPNNIGVSLNPFMRNVFFGRQKQVLNVGPVYTVTQFLPEIMGDLYQSVGDLPGMDSLYSSVVGRPPPD